MFVDEVGEAHHAIFTSCGVDENIVRGRQEHRNEMRPVRTFQLDAFLDSLTPQFDQFGQDDEAGFLSDGVGEIHGSLDDGEHNSLDVLCSWKHKVHATK